MESLGTSDFLEACAGLALHCRSRACRTKAQRSPMRTDAELPSDSGLGFMGFIGLIRFIGLIGFIGFIGFRV